MKKEVRPVNPIVSVLMPVYNAESFLKSSIESILGQTLSNFEFLIADDGSTDQSNNIIQYYAKKDSRIVHLKHEKNKGVVVTRNLLLDHAKGDYIAFNDADDSSDSKRLETQLSHLLDQDLDLVGAFATVVSENEKTLGVLSFPDNHDHMLLYLTHSYPFPNGTVFVKKHVVKNLRFENIEVEDYHFIFQLVSKSRIKLGNVPEFLYKYREHSENVSKKAPVDRIISKYAVGYAFIIKNFKNIQNVCQLILDSESNLNNVEKVSLLRATFYIGIAIGEWKYFFIAFYKFRTVKGVYSVFCHAKNYFKYRKEIQVLSKTLLKI